MRANLILRESLFVMLVIMLVVIGCSDAPADTSESETPTAHEDMARVIEKLKIENLIRDSLALAPDVEVILSYLEVPSDAELPLHYHPGEEFVYMIEGSGQLSLMGETITLNAGDFYKIPFKEHHSFKTLDEQGRAVVFRVHEKGQPDRILVEE